MKNRGRDFRFVCGLFLAVLLVASLGGQVVYASAEANHPAQRATPVTAVVRSQGAIVYDSPEGAQIERLVGGTLVSVLVRSPEGEWVLVRTRTGSEGWVEVGTLLLAGLDRLPVGEAAPVEEATATPTPEPAVETEAVPTPSPTPTSTPFAPPDGPSALALVRVAGADVWRIEDGSLADHFTAGTVLRAAARTADDNWYFVYDDTGTHGWAAAEEVLVLDGSALPVEEVLLPVETAAEDTVVVTVNDFGARLNLRAGPGTAFAIVARVEAGQTFSAIGRDASRTWIQVASPDLPSGTAWLAAAFVTVSVSVEELAVVGAEE